MKRIHKFGYLLAASVSIFAVTRIAAPSERVHLLPRFTSGESLRYQIVSQATTTGKTTTPIIDPEGASQMKQTTTLIVRLDVLDSAPKQRNSENRTRLRVTYEKVQGVSESDAYDPATSAPGDANQQLEGRTMEFTIEPGGKISDVTGVDDVLSNPSAAQTVRSWLAGMISNMALPANGIAIGQKWNHEQPLADVPLTGILWRTQSSYLRNEPCRASNAGANTAGIPAVSQDICAVILTRFEIARHGSRHGDATPEEYRHNGLRTSGTWTGSGESLDSISLTNGMVVASTETSSQEMDYEIQSARSGSAMHYKGRTETHLQITLLP